MPEENADHSDKVEKAVTEALERTRAERAEVAGDAIKEISEHARAEIDSVRSSQNRIATIVGLLVAVGLYFTYNSAKEWKDEIREDEKAALDKVRTDMATFEDSQRRDLQLEADQVRREVVKRVADEFDQKNVQDLVANEAQKRIDAVADLLIQKAITNQISPLRDELSYLKRTNEKQARDALEALTNSLSESRRANEKLERTIGEAQKSLALINQRADFIMTVVAAQSDNRAALEKLMKYGLDANSTNQPEAYEVAQALVAGYTGIAGDRPYATLIWPSDIKPESFNSNQIEAAWQERDYRFSRGFTEFIWGHTNIDITTKLWFMHQIMTNSHNSLNAANRAAYLISSALGAQYNPAFIYDSVEARFREWARTNGTSISSSNTMGKPK